MDKAEGTGKGEVGELNEGISERTRSEGRQEGVESKTQEERALTLVRQDKRRAA